VRLAVANDHAGYSLKPYIVEILQAQGHSVIDCGSNSTDPVDFPDVVRKACGEVQSERADRALLICGTGAGAVMAANKMSGIRCGLGHDPYSAAQCVEHDDANALAIGAWLIGPKMAVMNIEAFLNATFDDTEDTRRRVQKLNEMI